jgi:exosortase
MDRRSSLSAWAAGAAIATSLVALYASVFIDLAGIWFGNDNYSHGPLMVPVAAYMVWTRRWQLAAATIRPSNAGLALTGASLLLLLIGTAGVEFFLMRVSALGVIAGILLFVAGWQWLRLLLWPLGVLALAIPIPPVIFYQVAFPLQLLASKFGVVALQLMQIPVFREGNVITLTHTTLEVTEACSGIRSIVSLFALGVLYGYFNDGRPGAVAATALASIPIAIVANGCRIAGTGIAAHFVGPAAATGFTHSFSGWVVFMTSVGLLILVGQGLKVGSSLSLGPAREATCS